jgi:hypothetical protein
MNFRRMSRFALMAGAAALLIAPSAWRASVGSGECGTLELVVNTGECVTGAGAGITRNKGGKLVDLSRCGTYRGRRADEDNFHKNSPTSNDPFNVSRDNDNGNIAVVYDDGTVVTQGTSGTNIDFIRAVKKFHLTHPDVYDMLFIFPNFNHAEGSFMVEIKNGIRGLGSPIHDDSATYGTNHLEGFVNFRNYLGFPLDANARISGNNDTTLTLLAQEAGHRWGAFVKFDSDPSSRVKSSTMLLGRGAAHWSYFANVPAATGSVHSSSLEGNAWVDLGTGSFQTINSSGTGGYSELDQYLMGFRLPSEVTSSFVINADKGTTQLSTTRPYTPELEGASPITVGGSRVDFVVDDVIRVEGARSPDATQSPQKLRMAFMLLAQDGSDVAQSQIDRLEGIRTAWESYFRAETSNRGSSVTAIGPVDMDEDGADTVTDCNDGDPGIHPLATEVCNRLDDDCNGLVDEGWDADGDFWTFCNGDCNDNNSAVNPDAVEIIGNGIDDDCDGLADNSVPVDVDFDGYSPPLDCDDTDPDVSPEGIELVDEIDNNCNGFVDCQDPTVITQSEKGQRRSDGFDNDCNEIIDG